MGIKDRLKRLETAAGGGGEECPVCGYDPQAPGPYEIVFDDLEDDSLEDEPEGPEFCDGCGRQLTIVFWDDLWLAAPEREEHGHGE